MIRYDLLIILFFFIACFVVVCVMIARAPVCVIAEDGTLLPASAKKTSESRSAVSDEQESFVATGKQKVVAAIG
jgi:hypothetical protein